MDYQFPLVATNRDGHTRVFNDADSFRSFAFDRANGGVGGYWLEGYSYGFGRGPRKLIRIHGETAVRENWFSESTSNTWIVRDDRGRVVDKKDFTVPYIRRGYRWTEEKQHAAENGLPIPGTGKCRRYKHSRQGAWSKNGKNGAHNQRKGIKLYEDPLIARGNFSEF